MSNWVIVTAVTVAYLILTLIIGIRARHTGESSTLEGYVTGGRSMGLVLMFFIMGAEIFSAFAFLGGPGWSYSKGAPALYILAYTALMASFGWLLAPRIHQIATRMGHMTQADLLAGRFHSRGLAVLIGIVSILGLIPYLTIQVVGTGLMFKFATGGRIPFWLGSLIATVVVMLYVYTSGLRGIGWTNFFQGVLMVVIAWILGFAVAHQLFGGVGPMFHKIAAEAPQFLTIPGGGKPYDWAAFSTAILISALGAWMWPHLFMRFYSADSARTLKKSLMLYPLFVYVMIPILIIGFAGILTYRDTPLKDVDTVLLDIVVNTAHFSPWLVGLMLSGALAAAMSTGANIAHSAATVAARDVIANLHPMDDSQVLRLTRMLVLVISALGYILALLNPASLVSTLLAAYGAIVQLLPLTLAVLFMPRATRVGAFAGLICGTAVTLLFDFVWTAPYHINPGIWGLLINIIVLIIVSLATAPMDQKHLTQFRSSEMGEH
ncbi:putative symporter YodF [Castellaniella defragrans]